MIMIHFADVAFCKILTQISLDFRNHQSSNWFNNFVILPPFSNDLDKKHLKKHSFWQGCKWQSRQKQVNTTKKVDPFFQHSWREKWYHCPIHIRIFDWKSIGTRLKWIKKCVKRECPTYSVMTMSHLLFHLWLLCQSEYQVDYYKNICKQLFNINNMMIIINEEGMALKIGMVLLLLFLCVVANKK